MAQFSYGIVLVNTIFYALYIFSWSVLVLLISCKIVRHQVSGRMCVVVFHAFTLKLPIQTLLFAVPTHPFFLGVPHNISKTSTLENPFLIRLSCNMVQCIYVSVLQMTDVDLDARVTALEENGDGSAQNGNNKRHIAS